MDEVDAILAASESEESDLDIDGVNLEDILRDHSDNDDDEIDSDDFVSSKLEFLKSEKLLCAIQSTLEPGGEQTQPSIPLSSEEDSQMLTKLLKEEENTPDAGGGAHDRHGPSATSDIESLISSVENELGLADILDRTTEEVEFWEETGLSQQKLNVLLRRIAADSKSISGERQTFPPQNATAANSSLMGSVSALEAAAARERAILTAGSRDSLVSPLQVKRAGRRGRPGAGLVRVEALETISRQLRKNAQYMARQRGFVGPESTVGHPHREQNIAGGSLPRDPGIGPGLASAVATHGRFVAIGTTMGLVLVFDHCQEIKQIIKSSSEGGTAPSILGATSTFSAKVLGQVPKRANEQGADSVPVGPDRVTALDFSFSGEFLVCGYESGRIVLWDITKGAVLKNVPDAHKAAVTFAQFYHKSDPCVISVDQLGTVNKLVFSKLFWATYVVDLECLLDGAAGPIRAVSVLPYWYTPTLPNSTAKEIAEQEPFGACILIGLSSEKSTFVIQIHPDVRVLHKWSRPANANQEGALPCLAWNWPQLSFSVCLLARGWGTTLEILQVSLLNDPTGDQKVFRPVFQMKGSLPMKDTVLAIGWLGPEALVCLSPTPSPETSPMPPPQSTPLLLPPKNSSSQNSASYQLSVFDVAKATCLESLPLQYHGNGASLVRSSAFSAELPGTLFPSFRTCRARLYLLGEEELRSATVQSWEQRIDFLLDSGEWLEALAVALDNYERLTEATTSKGMSGQVTTKYMADLLMRYLRLAVDNAPSAAPGASDSSLMLVQSHYQMLAGVCLEFCAITERLDLLYGPIFQKFANVGQLRILLDCLEAYVLSDRIHYIAPEPMATIIEHCQQRKDLAVVERVLLHLDVKILDFDHIIRLLKAHKLYSSIFHVYTKGLQDYVTPLQLLMEEVFNAVKFGSSLLVPSVYKGLLYLRNTFAGKGFPVEVPIEEDKRLSPRAQLMYFLLQPHPLVQELGAKSTIRENPREMTYPYLRAFLAVDLKETLLTLTIGLDIKEQMVIASDEMESDHFAQVFRVCRTKKSECGFLKCPHPQFVASAVLAVLLEKESGRTPTLSQKPWGSTQEPWKPDMLPLVYDFLANHMETGKLRLSGNLTGAILSHLFDLGKDKEARLCSVVSHLGSQASSDDRLNKAIAVVLRRCEEEAPPLNRAAVAFHQLRSTYSRSSETSRLHFTKALSWILYDADVEYRKLAFSYIEKELHLSRHSSSKITPQDLCTAILEKIHKLVETDSSSTVRIIYDAFGDNFSQVYVELQSAPHLQFAFMNAVATTERSDGSPPVAFTPDENHLFVKLMCELSPEKVYKYLTSHDNYNLEQCLKACSEHNVTDAQAYLLEKQGDVGGALELVLSVLLSSLNALRGALVTVTTNAPRDSSHVDARSVLESTAEGNRAKTLLQVAVELCQRAVPPLALQAGAVNEALRMESPSVAPSTFHLWFRMLDRLFEAKGALAQHHQGSSQQAVILQGVVNWTIQRALDGMSGRVPLYVIVKKITDDHASQKLGDFKDVFLNMVETYTFEINIFTTAAALMFENMVTKTKAKYRLKASAIRVTSIDGIPITKQLYHKKAAFFSS